ncbi:unnamed protein product [marine sediment metagenome]|uniref:Phage tail collar domain-containing protein n=1 Tax=marine sediment metagenome TaxID=412755 RepID=X1RSW2_9ZZZZ
MVKPPYRIKNMMPGMIMGWPWGIDTIPSGWHLCDGTAGTPDYRNCFLVGAGDAYDPGDAGGSDSQTHTFTGDGHSHTMPGGTYIAPGSGIDNKTNSSPAVGTTDPADNRPQYKAMCWIMKL